MQKYKCLFLIIFLALKAGQDIILFFFFKALFSLGIVKKILKIE